MLRERFTTTTNSTMFSNFTSPPRFTVKWGIVRQFRCVKKKEDLDHDYPSSSSSPPPQQRVDDPVELAHEKNNIVGVAMGMDAVREKLMLDLQSGFHSIRAAMFSETGAAKLPPSSTTAPSSRPWNLRTRRAVCKDPNGNGNGNGAERKASLSPTRVKLDGESNGNGKRAKFSVALSKQEIEEDVLGMLGTRPARRPKKRPKHVQRQLDPLFPGSWLSEVTPDMYKVNENPEAGKR